MADENPLLQRAVSLNGDPFAIREFYAGWAKTYDTDLLLSIGYVAPMIAADALVKNVGKEALVLDAGCGTGLVGIELIKRNYDLTIDGIDLTPEMLEHSRKKGAYRKLNEADLTGPLFEIADDTYEGVVSAGVFTNGHVGPDGIDELLRILKPGAPLVLTVRDSAWEADGFKDKVEKLEADGTAKLLEVTHSPYHTKEDIFCQLVVLQAA
ncbi:class I SAM-dependent methyltransferase [Roseibium denhamense]|uniref:Methyltransferase domain-containing protein n=1 Tax=Roseibium denhamense TaxID=76305 RepID=A0ABY1PI46_9HYPH|nr:class I SAM-dependent methyltransferase [Roseibium denhamense]MTI05572.1 class I SAM-dependent methyltransferase [Roseibium denhamense]SMP34753.1 Methyltransferase domain-containing protein [Roseibium denhamense]